MHLGGGGYLLNPLEGDGKLLNSHVVPLEHLAGAACLVLLGEPGAGKTQALADERIRDEARIGAVDGSYLRLDLRDVTSPQDLRAALNEHPTWARKTGPLCLVLDSLDETPFGAERLSASILEALDTYREDLQLRIVCRTAEWPEILEQGLVARWPTAGIYEIAPLRRIDVETAATAHGLDPVRVLAVFADREAEPFALRPVTLRFLLRLLEGGRPLPRSKQELYEKLCRSLCEEPSGSRSRADVSPDERLALAERIAASLLYGGKSAVFIDPDRGDVPQSDMPLYDLVGDRERVEGDMFVAATEPALRDALGTGLFNSRGRGRLGFAHHSFGEYLAARYVARRGFTPVQIRALIVHAGLARVVPSLHGVGAWLASANEEIFRFVLERDAHVLLGADASLFDRSRKRWLTEKVIDRYRQREHVDRDPFQRPAFQKLAFDGLRKVLTPVIRDRRESARTREVAIEIARAGKVVALAPLFLSIVRDQTEDLGIRTEAAYAVVDLAGANERLAMKPFATEVDPSDIHDDLKGTALRALWPAHLTTAVVLSVLTPTRAPFRTGAYAMFVHFELPAKASDEDMLVLLGWTQTQGSRSDLAEPMRGLVDEIFRQAWKRLGRPGFVEGYARAAAVRIRHHDLPIVERRLDDDPWNADAAKRRSVLHALLPVVEPTDDGHLRFREMLRDDDFGWLLTLLDESLEPRARLFLVGCLASCAAIHSFDVINALSAASVSHVDLNEALQPALGAVPIDGPKANEGRATLARLRAILAERNPRAPPAPVAARVSQHLDAFEAGNIGAYWAIDFELGIDEQGVDHLTILKSDITGLPGWAALDNAMRRRLLDAAASYLRAGKCSPESWVGMDHEWNPALAGYRALRLLRNEDLATFEQLPPEVWAEWAPIVGGFPGLDAAQVREHGLYKRAYAQAPERVVDAVVGICRRDQRQTGHICAQRRVEPFWDERVAGALAALVVDGSLQPDAMGDLLDTLVEHGTESAVAFALKQIQLPVPRNRSKRRRMLHACASLVRHRNGEGWSRVLQVLKSNPAFGREIVMEVAHGALHRDIPVTATLAPKDCVTFLLWLDAELVNIKNPDRMHPAQIGPHEQVANLRRSALQELAHRGTRDSLEALRAAEKTFRGRADFRWAVLEAEHRTLAQTWCPVPPRDLRALAQDASNRLVSDADDLLEVVRASLERLEARLHGESRAVQFLWDRQHGGAYMPVDENAFSDFVREHLQSDLVGRGIVLNREVQLRPSVAPGTGQRTDIHIDAVAKDGSRSTFETLTMVIEVKGAWNSELFTAMKSQLRDRYLSGTQASRGIYLAGWFASALWTKRDSRRARVPREGIEVIAARLREQARVESDGGVRIEAVVLDATLPDADSAKRAPNKRRPPAIRPSPARTPARGHGPAKRRRKSRR
jgi:hypothetical protein